MIEPAEENPVPPTQALRQGVQAFLGAAPWVKSFVAVCFLLFLIMAPIGRSGPDDGGGLLAPLTVDSGELHRTHSGLDFYSIYDAGARWLSGGDPYESPVEKPVKAPFATDFRYPPMALVWLAAPLSLIPVGIAFGLWVVCLYAMTIANFLLCAGRCPAAIPVFAVIFFAWFPFIAEAHMGQFSLLVGTLLLWGIDGLRNGKAPLGIAWALALFTKVFPILIAPTLFLWGYRKIAIGTLVIFFLSIGLWAMLGKGGFQSGLMERDINRSFIGQMAVPYAGWQGVQGMVNAGAWKLSGRTMLPREPWTAPARTSDPVFLINAALIILYGALCIWALVYTRSKKSLAAIGIFWMAWFVGYRDCWEHHYLMFQPLVALLLAWKIIDWRIALACWVFAGTPSLWWLWQRTGYTGNFKTELIGTLYFFQRPMAIFLLTGVLIRSILKDGKSSDA